MAKRSSKHQVSPANEGPGQTINLSEVLSEKPQFVDFSVWLIGDTPLITHAWSEKARRSMLQKQGKAVRGGGLAARDPVEDFRNSLYEIGKDTYGFPVTGIKNCIMSAAHKDKGVAKTNVMSALWLKADMVRVRPAIAGAICDMPLTRIYGSKPEMREDPVKIGLGLNKISFLAYRAQFTTWAVRIEGRLKVSALTVEQLSFLINEAGTSYGIGEWRNERKGTFGAFHLARVAEMAAWEKFAAGKGPLPTYAEAKLPIAAE